MYPPLSLPLHDFYLQRELSHRVIRRPEDLIERPSQRIQYLVAGNGIFLESMNELLHARQCLAGCRIKGLLEIEELFELRIPRVPGEILTEVTEAATAYAYASPAPMESLFFIYYARQESRFYIVEPEQDRQPTQVHYRMRPATQDDVVQVADIHSHHFMSPYLSATDRDSSLGFGLYGVLGHLDKGPRLALYLGIYGEFFPLAPDLVFNLSDIQTAHLCECDP